VTRTYLSRMLLVAGVAAFVACGPRLKPVEYEEPEGSGTGAPDDDEPSTGSKKKSSSADGDKASSSEGSSQTGSGHSGSFKSCGDAKEKTCGSPCTECAPGNQDCMEVLVMKQCNLEHKCVAAPVDCTAPEKKSDQGKKK
jgi:hypothetical protein